MRKLHALAAACAVAIGSGCGPVTTAQNDPFDGRLVVSVRALAAQIQTVVIAVTAPDLSGRLLFNLPLDASGEAVATLGVPAGNGRTFLAQAFDTTGVVAAEGTTTIDVVRGTNAAVKIPMYPKSGHVPVDVQLAAYALQLTPTSATLVPGADQQFTAVVLGADLKPVAGAAVQWATSNPAVVTVDATGKAHAMMAGTGAIGVTFEGVAAEAQVTVQ